MPTDLGTDIDCGQDLSPTLGLVSGRKGLAQAILRRITTPRGLLPRHPNFGIDVASYLNETLDAGELLSLQQGITAQCLDDERVRRAAVSVASVGSRALRIRIDLSDAAGPFRLVFAVSALAVVLLEAT